jgi:polar amino acid transport system substrate-binding protein
MKKLFAFLVVLGMFLTSSNADDLLKTVQNRGVLKAGVKYDFPPFGYVNAKGQVVGFDIDLVKYIAKKLGVKPEFVQVTSKTRIPMVQSGTVDIAAASMTHKVKRDLPIDFTISYFFDGQSLLVPATSSVKSYNDLSGKRVAVIQGATSGDNLKKVNPKVKLVYLQEYPQAVMALRRGKVAAVSTDYTWCMAQAKASHGKLKVVGGTFTNEPYGMGVRENQSNFRDAVNFALQDAVRDGTYAKLYKKWFDVEPNKLPEVWPK